MLVWASSAQRDREVVEATCVAYVFPGQGAQRVGMGADLYAHYSSARDVFEEVDEALGFPLCEVSRGA